MKESGNEKNTLIFTAVLTLAPSLTACGGEVITKTTGSLDQQGQVSASDNEAPVLERTATGTMLLDGKETAVYLEVSDTEINFWDSASGGKLLAVAKYPETFAGATEALKGCDYTDLDEDGNSNLTAEFTFPDGSTASLAWFYADGGLVYNEEFSRFPGEATAAGTNEASKHFIFRMARAFCTGSEWGGASVPAFAGAADWGSAAA